MSVNPRTALAWLLSVVLMAACSPALAKGPGGGGGGGSRGGGGGSSHAASGFSGGNSGHAWSGNVGHNWSGGTPYMASRPFNSGIHTGSFATQNGNWNWGGTGFHNNWSTWNHGGNFWRNGLNWGDWGRYGYYRPWIGLGGWWPGYYDYGYGYPSYDYYDYGYPYGGDYYSYDVAPSTAYSPETVDYAPATVESETPAETAAPMLAGSEPSEFQSQALNAFRQGEYQQAVRLATHAIVDDPKSADAHLLRSLAVLAAGLYRGAAMEAHAVVALGMTPDWAMVANIYNNDVDPYTTQLRALEKFVRTNLKKPEGRFLLGFQYMIDGHRDVARDQFLQALQLAPRDRLAAQLLTKQGGTIPADIAKQLQSARQQPPTSQTGSSMTK
jgi:tetratricopeptide (TPR) repeat protein